MRIVVANRDPITGHPVEDDYKPVFDRSLMSVPAPIGVATEPADV
jgi:hypothetical protein